jgi:hypothetical protein
MMNQRQQKNLQQAEHNNLHLLVVQLPDRHRQQNQLEAQLLNHLQEM